MKSTIHSILIALTVVGTACFITSCAAPDTQHHVIVSVPEQRLALIDKGVPVATYPVSTSKFGLGDRPGCCGTPLGELEVAAKIGDAAPVGEVLKNRRSTGEIIAANAPGRDPIVTRIMWLRGREAQNQNAYGRYIYIHGTPEERNIGRPASYGCIRMRSNDVIQLYNVVGTGAQVTIINAPLRTVIQQPASGLTHALTRGAPEL